MSGKVLLLLTVVVLSGWGVPAGAGEKEKPPKGVGKYIMILRQPGATTLDRKKPMPPKKPVEADVTKRGGRVLERGEGRVVLFLPLKEARRLRADERGHSAARMVMYGQPTNAVRTAWWVLYPECSF